MELDEFSESDQSSQLRWDRQPLRALVDVNLGRVELVRSQRDREWDAARCLRPLVERLGLERVRMERVGLERLGMERLGMERVGMERVGMERRRVGVSVPSRWRTMP